MNKLLFACLWLTVCMTASAEDYARYYQQLPVQMKQVSAPQIPELTVSLTDFGGKGDGVADNTEAFKKAISQLSKQGGGHLNVPAGVWLTGPISLKDNIDLHLERNAIVMATPNKASHLKTDAKTGERESRATPFISASKRKNISITGEGFIDGNGKWWRPVKRGKVSDTEWSQYRSMGGTVSEKGDLWYPFGLKHFPNITLDMEKEENLRMHMVRFTDCENVLVSGVTLQNSPRFHFVPQRCRNVIIDGVTVRCPWNAQNGDAIDIGQCKQVLIVNNVIDCGDDGICMKGGAGAKALADGPCEDILIQDNTVFHAHGGFVIGSEFSGGMKNIVVRRCTFSGTDTGLRFKSAIGRGGKTESIHISDIVMNDIKDEAIVFETTYWDNHVGAKQPDGTPVKQEFVPDFTDIHINNITCRGCKTGIKAQGAKGMIHGIDISNANIFYTKTATDIGKDCDVKLSNVNLVTFE
ncbi:MAG: glycoside hydrolase family 28 protein [Prevotella sp.]|nr:glycoside hydrolase family 28 protein [Prevotella sp.]